jgi:hypothetical protein
MNSSDGATGFLGAVLDLLRLRFVYSHFQLAIED